MEHSKRIEELMDQLAKAPDEMSAERIKQRIEQVREAEQGIAT